MKLIKLAPTSGDIMTAIDQLSDPLSNAAEQRRARRLERSLRALQMTVTRQIDVLEMAAIENPDTRTPYGTRMADDVAVGVSALRELLDHARDRMNRLRGLLAVQPERVRFLAPAGSGEDYTTDPRRALKDPESPIIPEPVDDGWLEKFAADALAAWQPERIRRAAAEPPADKHCRRHGPYSSRDAEGCLHCFGLYAQMMHVDRPAQPRSEYSPRLPERWRGDSGTQPAEAPVSNRYLEPAPMAELHSTKARAAPVRIAA